MKPRIALAGFHHETNTFAVEKATLADFIMADNWPGLTRGKDFFSVFRQGNIPSVGFLQEINGVELIPLTWANAQPCGKVTQEAYQTIVNYILSDLKNTGEIDALYLDLHGAMVCEHITDGEGELLKQIRALLGDILPIIVSHDLHANVSDTMFALSDFIVSYRTYPHIDMAETGARAATALLNILSHRRKPYKAIRRFDYLIPLTAQCTLIKPCAVIYQELARLEIKHQVILSFNPCFPLSDTDYAGPTVLAYGQDQSSTNLAADEFTQFIDRQRTQFKLQLYNEQQAINFFVAHHHANETMVFADTQDNPGCGGVSNTMGIFHALVRNQIHNAVIAVVWDPKVAVYAHQHAIGDKIKITLGDEFTGEFIIKNLTNGQFIGSGDFYKDFHIDLGNMALLEYQGLILIVSSKKMQAADQAIFHHMGIEPKDYDLLVLKSSVHFRADFTQMASHILVVESPGENIADLNHLTYQHCHKTIL